MLPRAVRAASASGVPSQRAVQYVRWLTVAAGSEACRQSETVAGIIGIPRVPCTVALILLKGGLRITQEQLVAAARHRVAGLEIWVLSGDVGLTGLMDDCCDGSLELVSVCGAGAARTLLCTASIVSAIAIYSSV